jgi:hypothetical protein
MHFLFVEFNHVFILIFDCQSDVKYGKYSKPIILSDNMIQITNLDESKLYLFKNEGSIVPYFPIFGSSSADITKNKDDKKMIVVQGDENEILVYSFK